MTRQHTLSRLRGLTLAVGVAATVGLAGCSTAKDACEDFEQALVVFFSTKCPPSLGEALISVIDQQLACDDAVGIRDEEALREECIPALDSMVCDTTMTWPASCEHQFLYVAPPAF